MSESTILVIDDDETILTIICAILEDNGYTTISTQSGHEGIEKATQQQPDAILLDKMMPEISGDEVLKILKNNAETQEIPVLMLTAKSQIMEVSESLEIGACDYIVKPFDNDNLIVRLNNVLKK